MDDCIFCKIIRREVPATVLYEDADTFAFLSIGPNAPGHALVIPKVHSRNIFDLHESAHGPLMRTVQNVSRALQDSLGAEGVNVIMNNESAASQVVFHTHFHIIPRRKGDGLSYESAQGSYAPGEAEAVAEKIKAKLA